MANLIRINDEIISSDSFVKLLKLSGRFDVLIDDIVQEKLAVHSAKKLGVRLTPAQDLHSAYRRAAAALRLS